MHAFKIVPGNQVELCTLASSLKGWLVPPTLRPKLIAFYTQFKLLTPARKLFDIIPKSNIRGWVAVIGSYARHGFYEETMSMFVKMQREGLRCDRIVLPSVLKACGHLCDWNTGEELHAVILKNEFESDAFVMTALIDMYSKCGAVEKAKRVFDGMVEKDLVALNAVVSGYVQNGVVTEALSLVEEMKIMGVKPDVVTWNTLIAGFSQAKNKLAVEKIFRIMYEDGVKPDVVSWTSVITGFVQNFAEQGGIWYFSTNVGCWVVSNFSHNWWYFACYCKYSRSTAW
ncbi:Pentatricopeptide repeat-containing protein [Abeliophyllum distichum]|uniref:Pentatricopeptide repeat-containing protein n=1 Tax=Abeliophyllum distichum TaxID=126358 RepID=A0ABD1Q6U1_9LAMI